VGGSVAAAGCDAAGGAAGCGACRRQNPRAAAWPETRPATVMTVGPATLW